MIAVITATTKSNRNVRISGRNTIHNTTHSIKTSADQEKSIILAKAKIARMMMIVSNIILSISCCSYFLLQRYNKKMKPPNFLEVFCEIIIIFLDFIIFLIYDFLLKQVYAATKMVVDEMVAAADSDQLDDDGESDSDHHDDAAEEMFYDDDDAAALFDSSNNIDSSNMDSYIYSKSHHD